MGLLDIFGLGNMDGPLGGLAATLRDNAGMLSGFAADGFDGIAKGRTADTYTGRLRDERAEKLARVASAKLQAKALGIPEEMAAGDADGIASLYRYNQQQRMAKPSFEERLYNELSPEERAEYKQNKLLGGGATTNDIREYQYAKKNGFQGDFPAWMQSKSRDRQVIPSGYRLTPDGQTMEPFPGGPYDPNAPDKVLAGDRKMVAESEQALPVLRNTKKNLERALELNGDPDNGKQGTALSGFGSGAITSTVEALPDGWASDERRKQVADTRERDSIMSQGAIEEMASTLKGATTDHELRQFVAILADPNASRTTKARVLRRMSELADAKIKAHQTRADQIREGKYYRPSGGTTGAPPAPPAPSGGGGGGGNRLRFDANGNPL